MARDTLKALARRIGARLKNRNLKLATAESCTGGWVAQAVTSVSGSSAWFDRGFVTYSNEAKKELLGVRAQTLSRHGAVSRETAKEMAAGALARSRAQLAIAVTGVAGPSGARKRNRSARCASRGRENGARWRASPGISAAAGKGAPAVGGVRAERAARATGEAG